jgi:hypothetical protein
MLTRKTSCIAKLLIGLTTAGAACFANASSARAASPSVSSTDPFAPTACSIDAARVVATKVSPRAGLQAQADDSSISLLFSRAHSGSPLAMALELVPTPLDGALAVEPNERPLSAQGLFADAVWLQSEVRGGAPSSKRPALVSDESNADEPGGETFIVAKVDSGRWLRASVEGSIYTGFDVLVGTVGRDGEPIGDWVALSHEGNAMNLRPALAVGPSGRGVVAFVESNEPGFQVVASAIDCGAPAPAPTWATATRTAP